MNRFWALCLAMLLAGCGNWYKPVQVNYARQEINGTNIEPSPLSATLEGYSKTISAEMSSVIGELATTLTKSEGENTLGNFVADALLFGGNQTFGNIDVAIMNRGGVRLPELSAGPLTKGKIFELHPFDNILLCYTINGMQLEAILKNQSLKNAEWHIAGAKLQEGRWVVGSQYINKDADYRLVISDYLASVDDDFQTLKTAPLEDKNYLQRDAIIDYISHFKEAIPAPETNRIKS